MERERETVARLQWTLQEFAIRLQILKNGCECHVIVMNIS